MTLNDVPDLSLNHPLESADQTLKPLNLPNSPNRSDNAELLSYVNRMSEIIVN